MLASFQGGYFKLGEPFYYCSSIEDVAVFHAFDDFTRYRKSFHVKPINKPIWFRFSHPEGWIQPPEGLLIFVDVGWVDTMDSWSN